MAAKYVAKLTTYIMREISVNLYLKGECIMCTKKNQEVKRLAEILVGLIKEEDLVKRSLLASEGILLLTELGKEYNITIDDIDVPDFMKEDEA